MADKSEEQDNISSLDIKTPQDQPDADNNPSHNLELSNEVVNFDFSFDVNDDSLQTSNTNPLGVFNSMGAVFGTRNTCTKQTRSTVIGERGSGENKNKNHDGLGLEDGSSGVLPRVTAQSRQRQNAAGRYIQLVSRQKIKNRDIRNRNRNQFRTSDLNPNPDIDVQDSDTIPDNPPQKAKRPRRGRKRPFSPSESLLSFPRGFPSEACGRSEHTRSIKQSRFAPTISQMHIADAIHEPSKHNHTANKSTVERVKDTVLQCTSSWGIRAEDIMQGDCDFDQNRTDLIQLLCDPQLDVLEESRKRELSITFAQLNAILKGHICSSQWKSRVLSSRAANYPAVDSDNTTDYSSIGDSDSDYRAADYLAPGDTASTPRIEPRDSSAVTPEGSETTPTPELTANPPPSGILEPPREIETTVQDTQLPSITTKPVVILSREAEIVRRLRAGNNATPTDNSAVSNSNDVTSDNIQVCSVKTENTEPEEGEAISSEASRNEESQNPNPTAMKNPAMTESAMHNETAAEPNTEPSETGIVGNIPNPKTEPEITEETAFVKLEPLGDDEFLISEDSGLIQSYIRGLMQPSIQQDSCNVAAGPSATQQRIIRLINNEGEDCLLDANDSNENNLPQSSSADRLDDDVMLANELIATLLNEMRVGTVKSVDESGKPKKGRCSICPRLKDTKTTSFCSLCSRACCRHHHVILCLYCAANVRSAVLNT